MTCKKKDFRKPVVLSDVQGATFKALKITGDPGNEKDPVFSYKSNGVVFEK